MEQMTSPALEQIPSPTLSPAASSPSSTTTSTTTTTTATPTAPRVGIKQKLRLACDACLNAKVRCDKQHPSCQRCALSRRPCIYSPSRKSGRPAAARKRMALLAGADGANPSNTPAAISPRQTSPDQKSYPAPQQTSPPPPPPQQQQAQPSASSFNTVNASSLGSNANSKPLSTTSPSSSSCSPGHDSGIFLMEEWLDFNTSSSSQDFDSSQQEHHVTHQHPQHASTSVVVVEDPWLDVGKALESQNADDFSSYVDPSTVSPTFGGNGSPYSNSNGTEGLTSNIDLGADMFSSNDLTGSHFDPMEGITNSPISEQQNRHDCDQQAFNVLAAMQMLHQQQLASFSLDKVLDTNRTAINKLIELLDCSCALEPHVALQYAAIVPKILHWYRTAAKHLQPSSNTAVDSAVTSPSSSDSRQCSLLPQLGPISMSLGSFTLDESEQLDLTRRLVLSEVKKVEKIIAKMARVSVNGSTTLAQKEEHVALEASAPSRYAFACVTLRAELQSTIKQVGKGRRIAALMA